MKPQDVDLVVVRHVVTSHPRVSHAANGYGEHAIRLKQQDLSKVALFIHSLPFFNSGFESNVASRFVEDAAGLTIIVMCFRFVFFFLYYIRVACVVFYSVRV